MTGLAALLALAAAQGPPVFPTRVEQVYVDVLVTKGDAPVSGLGTPDFRVEDEGVVQRAEVVDRTLLPTSAVLALDTSASVAGAKLVHLKEAARVFVTGLSAGDEAALVTINEKIVLGHEAGRDRAAFRVALDQLTARGGTRVIDALYVCLTRHWGTGRPLVVLFTDGQDSASWLENDDILRAARESAALLHVVGTEPAPPLRSRSVIVPSVGLTVQPGTAESGYVRLLRLAAETTGGAYWPVESVTDIPAAFQRILEAANARYVLRYEPTGVPREGRHRLKVSVRRRGVHVRARREYLVTRPSE